MPCSCSFYMYFQREKVDFWTHGDPHSSAALLGLRCPSLRRRLQAGFEKQLNKRKSPEGERSGENHQDFLSGELQVFSYL